MQTNNDMRHRDQTSSTRARRIAGVARVALGLIFGLSGLNHIAALVPMPPMAGQAALFYEGLRQTGYFFPLLGCVEVAAGLMLLSGRFTSLGLALAAPIV